MDSVKWQQSQGQHGWSSSMTLPPANLDWSPQRSGDLDAKLAHAPAEDRKHMQHAAGRHYMDSSQEAHLIKAFQGHAFTPAVEPSSTSPNTLHRRQQEWLNQSVAAKPSQTPTLPEIPLQLPASVFGAYSHTEVTPSTCQPMEEDPKPLIALENHGSSPPLALGEALDEGEPEAVARTSPLRSYVRQASSIKPRERREPERYGSKTGTLKASSSMPSFSRRSSGSGQSDGVMMLLQACEALDSRRVISPTSSYSPSRPPRPRGVSDLERIRASFSRAHSDSLLGSRGSACSTASAVHKREKENAAAVAIPAKKTAVAKPAKARRGRSELHGPCCHCLATDSPQWRKGPKCKPILCNACGTRFLRTRSLGKSMGKTSSKRLSFSSSASSCNNDDTAALSELTQEEEMGEDTLPPSHTSQDGIATQDHYHQDSADHSS